MGGLGLGTFKTPYIGGKACRGVATVFHGIKLLGNFFQGVVPDLVAYWIQLFNDHLALAPAQRSFPYV